MKQKIYSSQLEYQAKNPYLLISSMTGEILERGRTRKELEAKSLRYGAIRCIDVVTATQYSKMKFESLADR